jgi:hypothetical protein
VWEIVASLTLCGCDVRMANIRSLETFQAEPKWKVPKWKIPAETKGKRCVAQED